MGEQTVEDALRGFIETHPSSSELYVSIGWASWKGLATLADMAGDRTVTVLLSNPQKSLGYPPSKPEYAPDRYSSTLRAWFERAEVVYVETPGFVGDDYWYVSASNAQGVRGFKTSASLTAKDLQLSEFDSTGTNGDTPIHFDETSPRESEAVYESILQEINGKPLHDLKNLFDQHDRVQFDDDPKPAARTASIPAPRMSTARFDGWLPRVTLGLIWVLVGLGAWLAYTLNNDDPTVSVVDVEQSAQLADLRVRTEQLAALTETLQAGIETGVSHAEVLGLRVDQLEEMQAEIEPRMVAVLAEQQTAADARSDLAVSLAEMRADIDIIQAPDEFSELLFGWLPVMPPDVTLVDPAGQLFTSEELPLLDECLAEIGLLIEHGDETYTFNTPVWVAMRGELVWLELLVSDLNSGLNDLALAVTVIGELDTASRSSGEMAFSNFPYALDALVPCHEFAKLRVADQLPLDCLIVTNPTIQQACWDSWLIERG